MIVIGDQDGITWGEGETLVEAFADWRVSMREIREMLDGEELSPMMAKKRDAIAGYGTMIHG